MLDLSDLVDDASQWCRDKSALARAPLLVFFAYMGVRHVSDSDYQGIFGALNLGIHEGGHMLFGVFGQSLMVAGGTLIQLAAPIASGFMFRRQRDYFAISVAGAWLATNLYSVATYMADAREMDLPLVNVGGGEVEHDWNYMLRTLGLLAWDTRLAGLVRVLAFVVMWSSLAAGAWLLWRMARASETAE